MPFDRHLRRLRRERGVTSAGEADFLTRFASNELTDRLDLVKRRFGVALNLGSGHAYLSDLLRDRGIEVVSADSSFAYARATGGLQCDEDRLPFADGSFDLIVSAGVLDSVNDLPGALTLIRRALRPDGLFLGAFVGAGSLMQLKGAMLAADEAEGGASPRIHPQIDVRAAGDLLVRAGFALPVADWQSVDVRFADLRRLVADLRAMGATNVLASRSRRPVTRLGLAAAMAQFSSRADPDGKTSERFEIIHMLGWAPAPGQPRPARRGSATLSLAEALEKKEQ